MDHPRPDAPDASHDQVPSLAVGVELLGPLAGSGYRTAPHLVRRADGQTLQLTPLLASVLAAVDGRRDLRQVAEVVGDDVGREIAPEDVAWLLQERIRPLGLLARRDGEAPQVHRHRSLLGLRGRIELLSPKRTAALARPLQVLFHRPVVLVVLAAFAALTGWTIFDKGLGDPIDAALADPGLLLGIIAATIASAAFHELGHAAAARHGGATPGAIGAAVYLVWPVFFTDVTDSYRLPKADRLRVDLGGLYFNAVFVVGVGAAWLATGREGLLVLVPLTLFQMVRQLTPVVRFDGYHILADLVGVPDLFARIRPTLAGALPGRRAERDANPLRPWAQRVVVTWVAVVVPTLLVMLALLVWHLPDMVVQAADTLGRQAAVLAANLGAGDLDASVLGVIAMVTVAFIPLSAIYLMGRIGGRGVKRLWSATEGRLPARTAAGLAIAGLVFGAGPSMAALPRDVVLAATGSYEVVAASLLPADEAATFPAQGATLAGSDLHGLDRDGLLLAAGLDGVDGTDGHVIDLQVDADPARAAQYASDRESARAAKSKAPKADKEPKAPKVPKAPAPEPAPEPEVEAPRPDLLGSETTWPFAFDRPAAPGVDDNQVVVVNQTDGASRFDFRTDVSWTSGEVLDAANRAYALAQCVDCRTVAVAFQVVAALDATRTAVPQNISLAGNVDCDTCVTRAVAVQLAVTLEREPDNATRTAVGALVAGLEAQRDQFATASPDEILAVLQDAKEEALLLLQPFIAEDAVAMIPGREAAPLAATPDEPPADLVVLDAPVPTPVDEVVSGEAGADDTVESVPDESDAPTVTDVDGSDAVDGSDVDGSAEPGPEPMISATSTDVLAPVAPTGDPPQADLAA